MEDLQLQDLSGARRGLRILAWCFLLSLISLTCADNPNGRNGNKDSNITTPSVTVDTLYHKATAGEDIFVIDVRTEPEYTAARLAFTDIRVSYDSIGANLHMLPGDKTLPIYSVCRSGRRSGISTRYLQSIGYINAYNVTGGILAWQQKGYPTVGDSL